MMEETENQIIQAFRTLRSGKNTRLRFQFGGYHISGKRYPKSRMVHLTITLPEITSKG